MGLFDFGQAVQLLGLDFVRTALIAGAVLGLVAGVLAPLIVARNMAFSVHATAEIAFSGGAAALLLGISIGYGALGAAVLIAIVLGVLSRRDSERDSVIGVVLASASASVCCCCRSTQDGRRTSSACWWARSSAWTRRA